MFEYIMNATENAVQLITEIDGARIVYKSIRTNLVIVHSDSDIFDVLESIDGVSGLRLARNDGRLLENPVSDPKWLEEFRKHLESIGPEEFLCLSEKAGVKLIVVDTEK